LDGFEVAALGARMNILEEPPNQLPWFVEMIDAADIEVDAELAVERGEVPRDVDLTYWAGGWYRRARPVIPHLLDAWSTASAVRITRGGGHVRVRPCADPLREAEERAGRILRKGMFTRGDGLARFGVKVGRSTMHECLLWDGRLIGTSHIRWFSLDPRTLSPAAEVIPEARGATRGLNMHPMIDPRTGALVTHSFEVSSTLGTTFDFLERTPAGGHRERRYVSPRLLTPHAYSLTERYHVLPALPARLPTLSVVLGLARGALDRTRDDPDAVTSFHLVSRDRSVEDLVARARDRGYVYHVTNSFEDEGRVVIDAFVSDLNPERESSQFHLEADRPVWTHCGGVFRFTIDPRVGTVRKRLLLRGVQRVTFDCIDDRRRSLPYRYAWFCANEQHENGTSHVLFADVTTGTVQTYSTRDRVFLRQPRFVPLSPDAPEGEGFLVVPAHARDATRFLLFDARRVDRGPLAVLGSGRVLPYANHGWAAATPR